jgi:D-lactate dehydrogenase (cytochrome)
VKNGSSFESTWSGFEPFEIEKLKALRHGVPEAVNGAIARHKRGCTDIRKISTDAALPASAFVRVFDECMDKIRKSGIDHAVFGHLGDYHLHINLVPKTRRELETSKLIYEELMSLAIAAGGTVSAEHGIGKLKTAYLRKMYGEKAVKDMMRIKSEFDPLWLLNRGNLFDVPLASA